jgi:CBS-domain-containing membrane protein
MVKISDCMKRKVISSTPNTTIQAAAQILIQNHIGTLPVVDESSHLIGLVRMRDLITLAMPDFVHLVENVDFVHDFGAVENKKPGSELLNMPISKIMGETVAVEESTGLLRAVALLQEHKLNDLPVVDHEDRLVGIASYVDIGVALMTNWDILH